MLAVLWFLANAQIVQMQKNSMHKMVSW